MTLPKSIKDREHAKFREASNNQTKVAVEVENSPSNPILVSTNVLWDELITTFPAPNQDLFTYKKNTVTVMTVLVTYSSNNKKLIIKIKKVII